MVVKAFAAYAGLELVFRRLDDPARAHLAAGMAVKIAAALPGKAGADGVFPAVFEPDNSGYASRILPAAEGLLYPMAWAAATGEPIPERGEFGRAVSHVRGAIRRHTLALLSDPERRNVVPDGGIKLSSTSNNSWMSKIALFQHVARQVLRLTDDAGITAMFTAADAAHVRWQTEGASAFWACSDQMVKGVAKASRYYPRVITAALWLDERLATRAADADADTPEPDVAAGLTP